MKYEENKKWSTFWSWAFIFALSGSLLGWAMIMMTFVKDVPREWEFGNVEFTPAESVYSSVQAAEKAEDAKDADKNLIAPLPDGVSMEEENNTKTNNEAEVD